MNPKAERDKAMAALLAPFPACEIKWRVGRDGVDARGKAWAMVLAYVDARAVMDRLDAAVGAWCWQCRYSPGIGNGFQCEVGIRDPDSGEWLWRADGAEQTATEATKGGYSDSFKRACVKWGIARYLYSLGDHFAQCTMDAPPRGQGWNKTSKKGGKTYWWKTPTLPAWALPSGDTTTPTAVAEEPDGADAPDAPDAAPATSGDTITAADWKQIQATATANHVGKDELWTRLQEEPYCCVKCHREMLRVHVKKLLLWMTGGDAPELPLAGAEG